MAKYSWYLVDTASGDILKSIPHSSDRITIDVNSTDEGEINVPLNGLNDTDRKNHTSLFAPNTRSLALIEHDNAGVKTEVIYAGSIVKSELNIQEETVWVYSENVSTIFRNVPTVLPPMPITAKVNNKVFSASTWGGLYNDAVYSALNPTDTGFKTMKNSVKIVGSSGGTGKSFTYNINDTWSLIDTIEFIRDDYINEAANTEYLFKGMLVNQNKIRWDFITGTPANPQINANLRMDVEMNSKHASWETIDASMTNDGSGIYDYMIIDSSQDDNVRINSKSSGAKTTISQFDFTETGVALTPAQELEQFNARLTNSDVTEKNTSLLLAGYDDMSFFKNVGKTMRIRAGARSAGWNMTLRCVSMTASTEDYGVNVSVELMEPRASYPNLPTKKNKEKKKKGKKKPTGTGYSYNSPLVKHPDVKPIDPNNDDQSIGAGSGGFDVPITDRDKEGLETNKPQDGSLDPKDPTKPEPQGFKATDLTLFDKGVNLNMFGAGHEYPTAFQPQFVGEYVYYWKNIISANVPQGNYMVPDGTNKLVRRKLKSKAINNNFTYTPQANFDAFAEAEEVVFENTWEDIKPLFPEIELSAKFITSFTKTGSTFKATAEEISVGYLRDNQTPGYNGSWFIGFKQNFYIINNIIYLQSILITEHASVDGRDSTRLFPDPNIYYEAFYCYDISEDGKAVNRQKLISPAQQIFNRDKAKDIIIDLSNLAMQTVISNGNPTTRDGIMRPRVFNKNIFFKKGNNYYFPYNKLLSSHFFTLGELRNYEPADIRIFEDKDFYEDRGILPEHSSGELLKNGVMADFSSKQPIFSYSDFEFPFPKKIKKASLFGYEVSVKNNTFEPNKAMRFAGPEVGYAYQTNSNLYNFWFNIDNDGLYCTFQFAGNTNQIKEYFDLKDSDDPKAFIDKWNDKLYSYSFKDDKWKSMEIPKKEYLSADKRPIGVHTKDDSIISLFKSNDVATNVDRAANRSMEGTGKIRFNYLNQNVVKNNLYRNELRDNWHSASGVNWTANLNHINLNNEDLRISDLRITKVGFSPLKENPLYGNTSFVVGKNKNWLLQRSTDGFNFDGKRNYGVGEDVDIDPILTPQLILNRSVPQEVNAITNKFTVVETIENTFFGIDEEGLLWGWGNGKHNAFFNHPTPLSPLADFNQLQPINILNEYKFKNIKAYSNPSSSAPSNKFTFCGLTTENEFIFWGHGSNSTNYTMPHKVVGWINNFVKIKPINGIFDYSFGFAGFCYIDGLRKLNYTGDIGLRKYAPTGSSSNSITNYTGEFKPADSIQDKLLKKVISNRSGFGTVVLDNNNEVFQVGAIGSTQIPGPFIPIGKDSNSWNKVIGYDYELKNPVDKFIDIASSTSLNITSANPGAASYSLISDKNEVYIAGSIPIYLSPQIVGGSKERPIRIEFNYEEWKFNKIISGLNSANYFWQTSSEDKKINVWHGFIPDLYSGSSSIPDFRNGIRNYCLSGLSQAIGGEPDTKFADLSFTTGPEGEDIPITDEDGNVAETQQNEDGVN